MQSLLWISLITWVAVSVPLSHLVRYDEDKYEILAATLLKTASKCNFDTLLTSDEPVHVCSDTIWKNAKFDPKAPMYPEVGGTKQNAEQKKGNAASVQMNLVDDPEYQAIARANYRIPALQKTTHENQTLMLDLIVGSGAAGEVAGKLAAGIGKYIPAVASYFGPIGTALGMVVSMGGDYIIGYKGDDAGGENRKAIKNLATDLEKRDTQMVTWVQNNLDVMKDFVLAQVQKVFKDSITTSAVLDMSSDLAEVRKLVDSAFLKFDLLDYEDYLEATVTQVQAKSAQFMPDLSTVAGINDELSIQITEATNYLAAEYLKLYIGVAQEYTDSLFRSFKGKSDDQVKEITSVLLLHITQYGKNVESFCDHAIKAAVPVLEWYEKQFGTFGEDGNCFGNPGYDRFGKLSNSKYVLAIDTCNRDEFVNTDFRFVQSDDETILKKFAAYEKFLQERKKYDSYSDDPEHQARRDAYWSEVKKIQEVANAYAWPVDKTGDNWNKFPQPPPIQKKGGPSHFYSLPSSNLPVLARGGGPCHDEGYWNRRKDGGGLCIMEGYINRYMYYSVKYRLVGQFEMHKKNVGTILQKARSQRGS